MGFHIKTTQEQVNQIIRLTESESGEFEKTINKYNAIEFYLIALLLFTCLYVELFTTYIFLAIATIAIIIAVVDYKKQQYDSDRW